MKFLKYFLYAVFFAAVFSAGLWIFAPWDEGTEMALCTVKLEAARRGYYLTCDGVRREGFLFPSYHFNEIDVEGPMIKATFSDFTVNLESVRSFLYRRASFRAEFGGAAVRYVPNNSFAMGRGETGVSAGNGAIVISNADIEGDVAITGDMVFDAKTNSITESTMTLTVPPEMGMILGTPMMNRFVESVSPGKWRIRENAGGD